MSEDKPSGDKAGGDVSLASMAAGIVDDCLYNIIHEIVLETHRSEKLLRMQSAATIAEQAAIAEHTENSSVVKGSQPSQPPSIKIDTPAAVYDNGRVTLRGNPFKTTPEIICQYCKLPRLMYPISGVGSQMPDLSKQYCTRYPFVSKSGHDIYNNPFPTDMAKSKKERELMKRAEKDNTPGSQEGGNDADGLSKLNTGGKPAHYIPWHTCPNCKRSLLITRFAQHAEKCLGISGRQSSRNAMAKINSSSGTLNGNTPLGSRLGTPVPGSQTKNVSPTKGGDDDDGDETLKKKKKSSYVKKADREKGAAGTGKEKKSAGTVVIPAKRPPKESADKEGGDSKRGREKDGNGEDAPRKKLKLTKEPSNVSEVAGPGSSDSSAS